MEILSKMVEWNLAMAFLSGSFAVVASTRLFVSSSILFVFQVFGILMLFYRICIYLKFIYIEIDILSQQMSLVRYTTI